MAQTIATAYVDIMPSTRGLKAALDKEVTPVAKQVGTTTGKAMGDAISTETGRSVGPAMKKVLERAATEGKVTFATKIRGIGASLSDEFNQTGKISGTLSTVGASMGLTGEKARGLAERFRSVQGASNGMQAGLSGVSGILMGPWGIALAGAGLALNTFITAQENAQKAGDELAKTLNQQSGAATFETYRVVAANILKEFSSADLAQTPFTLQEITSALIAGGDQLAALKARIKEAGSEAVKAQGLNVVGANQQAEAYNRLTRAVDNLGNDQATANQIFAESKKAYDAATAGARAAGVQFDATADSANTVSTAVRSIPNAWSVTITTNLAQVVNQAVAAANALAAVGAAGAQYSAGAALNDYAAGIRSGKYEDPIAAAQKKAAEAAKKAAAKAKAAAAKAKAAARAGRSGGGAAKSAADSARKAAREALLSSISGTFVKDTAGQDAEGIDKLTKTLIGQAKDALSGAKETALVNLLKRDNTKLKGLATQRASIQKQIGDAESKLADLKSQKASTVASVSQNLTGNLVGARSASGIKRVLTKQLAQVKAFGANIRALDKRGLPKAFLKQLLDAGLDGAATAAALVRSSGADFEAIKNLTNELTTEANKLGVDAGSILYDEGIATMQGLINGLKSQDAALEAQMLKIAKSMKKAIKQALGIKSPSKVFEYYGRMTGRGMARGVDKSSAEVNRSIVGMVRIPQQRASRAVVGGSTAGQVMAPQIQVYAASNPIETAHRVSNEIVWRSKR